MLIKQLMLVFGSSAWYKQGMSEVQLVGILNVTPDSFSDGGQHFNPEDALIHAKQLFDEGASIIDIGAESTRPGATPISAEEEWRRLYPVLDAYASLFHETISVDTYRPETIRRVVEHIGPVIINDVTAFRNPEMIEVAAELELQCIVGHLPARFKGDIQAAHKAEQKIDDQFEVRDDLLEQRQELIDGGVHPDRIKLDPCIGYNKTLRLNWELLEFPRLVPGIEVMIGASNKKFLSSIPHTDIQPANFEELRANPDFMQERNLYASQLAIAAGAKYLRVHDVALHQRLI